MANVQSPQLCACRVRSGMKSRRLTPSSSRVAERGEARRAVLGRPLDLSIDPIVTRETQSKTLRRAQRALAEPVGQANVGGHGVPPVVRAGGSIRAASLLFSVGRIESTPFSSAARCCAAF